MTNDTKCKNCDTFLVGNFCSSCGQKADTHRITFAHFLYEFFHALTHTDRGILLLMKALILRPGDVAKEYLDGKRKKYFNPLTFIIIISSIYAFLSYKTGYFEALSGFDRQIKVEGEVYTESMQLMLENRKILNLFLMPVLVSFLSWIFFRKQKTNMAENIVLNSFVLSQIYLIMIVIFIPGFLLFPETIKANNYMSHGLMLGYMSLAYHQFFKGHVFLTVLKTALIIVLFILLFWLSIMGYVMLKHLILG
ncbi:DUF3667 domain-containing protein [Undibacterium amnicola]|uniref:DUF3667 domain-containing protein n=1 Tax=Undibacterium amnicola TaxID=1834038 RepID=A0ABR6XS73_9BURK|nr:DUF3667 domain-containing protein [Undibacterium amnicola]MBC3832315.1 DUF3667 domain-containing protein [Undibacterium amnicola]